MLYQSIFCIMFLLIFSKNEGSNYTHLLNTMQQEFCSVTKSLPLTGCSNNCSSEVDDVKFYLRTTDTPQNANLVDASNPTLLRNDKITVVIVFGWHGKKEDPWILNLTTTFITKYNYDVLVVDWSKLAQKNYIIAANATKYVGFKIGELLANSYKKHGILPQNFKVIGYSLGGEVAGFCGKKIQKLTGQKLALIVAINPAGPCFNTDSENERLCPNDAKVVHVIHCSAYQQGINFACGTLDTWVNGGCIQPGCIQGYFKHPLTVIGNLFCSHDRCIRLFMEALLHPQKLLAQECEPWNGCNSSANFTSHKKISIGEMETFESGEYCLTTTDTPPYHN